MKNLSIEEVMRSPSPGLIASYIEQNEIRDYMVENGVQVAPFVYQVECQCGRTQKVEDDFDSVRVIDPQCWGCPLRKTRSLKKCFGILSSKDIEEHVKEGKIPPFVKGREELKIS